MFRVEWCLPHNFDFRVPVQVGGLASLIMETRENAGHSPTVAPLPLSDWREWCSVYTKSRTASEYDFAVSRAIKLMGWPETIGATVTETQLREWVEARRGEGRTFKTVNNEFCGLRSLIKWAIETRQRRDDPSAAIKLPKGTGRVLSETMRPFTPAEVQAIIQAARREEADPDTRCRWTDGTVCFRSPIYEVMAFTGLRHSEACGPSGFRWSEVNLADARIELEGSTTKTGQRATLPLLPNVVETLRQWRARFPHAKPSDPVFPRKIVHEKLLADMARANVPRHCERGQPAAFHSFRHGLGKMLAVSGVPVTLAMQIMRHSDVKMTTETYAQHLIDDTRAAMKHAFSGQKQAETPVIHQGEQKYHNRLNLLDKSADSGILYEPANNVSAVGFPKVAATGLEPVTDTKKTGNVPDANRIAISLITSALSLIEEAKKLLA